MQRGRHEETPSQLLMPVTSWMSDTTPIAARRKEVAFIMNESFHSLAREDGFVRNYAVLFEETLAGRGLMKCEEE